MAKVTAEFLFEDDDENRKKLFEKALLHAKHGKVLYILQEELNKLPELSQDISSIERHYIKMISFLYTSSTVSLIESLASLTEWKNIPTTIILDSLDKFANKSNLKNACGIVALLLDTTRSCSLTINSSCNLYVAVTKDMFGEENCNLLRELYIL